VGELLNYDLLITNAGNATATGVFLTNTLPSTAAYFSASVSQGTFTPGATVVCNLGSISAGSAATVHIRAAPGTAGTITNLAAVTLAENDPHPADNSLSQTTLVVPLTLYAGPDLNVARSYHTATLLPDGRVLIAGGAGNTGTLASAEMYDPQTKTLTLTASMKNARSSHAATLLNDGTVLITGGYGPNLWGAEIFNPTNGTFTSVSNLNNWHVDHTATLLQDGRVLVEGNSYNYPYNAAEVYVPALHSFTNIPGTINSASRHMAFQLADGKVVLPGGTVGWSFYPGAASEFYDPALNAWTGLPPLNYTRYYYGGAQLLDGRILLAGGNISGQTAEFFYPNSQTFVLATNTMRTIHYFATANRLPDGKVLVAGRSAQPDLFDPANDSFSRTVDMITARQSYTATSLRDGSVLIAGGLASGNGAYLASTEIYDPARTKAPPAVSVGNVSVVEGNSGTTNLNFPLTLSSPMGVPVSVNYATASGSAVDGEDFLGTNSTIIIPAGATNVLLPVTVIGDVNYEQDETFTVTLTGVTNAVIDAATATATGTILNDDPIPTVSVAPAAVLEGNVRTTNLLFNVLLSGTSYQTVSVNFATADGTAQAGQDYFATNGTVLFDPGQTNQVVPVIVKGDVSVERDETLYLNLSSPTNATLGVNGVGTIVNDDGFPGTLDHFDIALTDPTQYATFPMGVTITAKDFNGNTVTGFTGRVAIRGSSTNTPSYKFEFEEGDFSLWSPLDPGGNYRFQLMDINGDGGLSTAFGLSPGSGPVYGLTRSLPLQAGLSYYLSADIAESCDPGVSGSAGWTTIHLQVGGTELTSFAFQPSFGDVYPGQIARTNIAATFVPPTNGSYAVTVTAGRIFTAYSYEWDWVDDLKVAFPRLTPNWTANFTDGVWSGPITAAASVTNFVVHVDDQDGHIGETAPFTILNYSDLSIQTTILPTTPRVGSNLVCTILVSNRGPGAATAIVVTNTLPPNSTFISASSTLGSCLITNGMLLCNLGTLSSNQSASVTLVTQPFLPGTFTSFSCAWSPDYDPDTSNNSASTSVTVSPPLIYISSPTVVERTGTTTNAQVQVWIGTPFVQTIDVDYTTAAPGQGYVAATAGDDYLATSGHLTFTPAATNQTITVTVLDDLINEPAEAFAVVLSSPVNAQLASSSGICSIVDNFDPLPLLSIADASLVEDNSGTNNCNFNVSLSRASGYTVTVRYGTSNGTAIGGRDFVTNGGTLTFPPGITSQTISVGVRGDTVKEPDETFFVTLSSPVNALIQRGQATGTIVNDDTAAGQLDHFEWSAVPQPQYATLTFPVTLAARDAFNSAFTGAITNTVNLTLAQGTTDYPTNFTYVSPSAAGPFVNGVWSGTVSISTAKSNVVLRADDGLQRIGSSNPFDVLASSALLLSVPVGANENAGTLVNAGKVILPRATGGTVTVNLSSSDTTEATVPSSVTVAAGQSNATFNITVVNDTILDGTQTATITASASAYLSATAPFSVYDDETATLTVSLPASVSEAAFSATGSVSISAPPGSAMTVGLTSSDPSRVQVPASLSFAQGQTSKSFTMSLINDLILQGTTSVAITAHVQNWTDGVATMNLTDNETNTLAFQFTGSGTTYPEGTLLVTNATLKLGGILTTNLTVSLASSDPASVTVPSTVVVPAGTNSVSLNLTIGDDALQNGSRVATLTATAPGFVIGTAQVTVTDNEWHHFGFSAIASPQQGSVAFALTLTARDVTDALEPGYSGYIALTAADVSGNPVPISPASVTVANGQWSGNVTVPTWEYAGVRITATDADGHASQSAAFDVAPPIVSIISLTAGDLAYSETSKLLYASTTNTGTLTPINPFTATVGTPIPVASMSGRLCASDGGQYVFAALNTASNRICQFDVNSQAVANAWTLDGNYVGDMCPVAGSPAAVAVSRTVLGGSPKFRGVAIYDNGLARSNVAGGFLGANVIEPAHGTNLIYGFDNESSPAGSQTMIFNASGITTVGGWGGPQGFGVDISCRGGLIFATTGQIFDPLRSVQVGSFSNTLVGDDAPSGRYYLFSSGAVVAYDQNTLLPVGVTALPGVNGAFGSLVRWGTNGFALRPTSIKIAIVRTPLISSGASADLRLSATLPALPIAASNVLTYTLTVANPGPTQARNVVISQTLPANATFLSATSNSGSNALVTGGVVCWLQNIPAGSSASFTVNLQTLKPGLLAALASVTSDSLDPNLTDNVLRLQIPVARPLVPGSVAELSLPTTDLAWDKTSGRIFASAPNSDWLLGNNILALDPLTGAFDASIPVALDPAKLAVAGNGQYLYAGINSDGSIQRVNLSSRAADLKFPTGYGAVADMAVLPGSPQSVAATAHTTFVVYDNGVARTNVVAPGAYNFDYFMAVSGSNSLAYETMPYSLRRIGIDAGGATVLEEIGNTLINGFDRQISYDAGLVYTYGGRIFNPETKTMVATLPFGGLVAPDSQAGRAFYLSTSGSVGTLHSVETTNFTEVGSVTVPGISGTATSLITWGTDGLAFRTTGGQLFLVRTTLADDRNNDGLPDSWQLQYFGSLTAPGSGPNDDPDHDGLTNLREYQTGSNPNLWDSLRFLTWQMQTNGSYRMTMFGTVGQNYALLASTNLAQWIPILNFTCTNIPTVIFDTATQGRSRRFYRLGPLTSIPRPRLSFGSAQPLSGNGLDLALEGFAGITYRIESSTNLHDWATLTSVLSTNALTRFRDPSALNQGARFYRAVVP
jgi:uncharacterized repeat protein (TIGR01451 family)